MLKSRQEFLSSVSESNTTENVDNKNVKIDWDKGAQHDEAGDGHCFFHHLTGTDAEGNKYTASGEYCDGELVKITDIEKE
jgi:hypothetical protein